MNVAVAYYSLAGHTKELAEEIANEFGVKAVSVAEEPAINIECDVLFLGGSPYFNMMAPELENFAKALLPEKIGRVVLFSTSNWSRRTVHMLRKILEDKGIRVSSEHFYAQVTQVENRKDAIRQFANDQVNNPKPSVGALDVPAIVSTTITTTVFAVAVTAVAVFTVTRLVGRKRK